MLESLKQSSASLAEQVAEQISKYIIENQLVEGDKLPSESALAEAMGIGRSTLREAIKLLASRNIVEIRRGIGTYVANRPGVVNDPFGFRFMHDKKKLAMDILDMRYIIEPPIAAMAARYALASDVERLSELNALTDAAIRSGEDHSAQDIAFHSYIAKCSRNEIVSNLIPILDEGIHLFIDFSKSDLLDETTITHRAILDAIAAGNEDEALETMRAHLDINKRYLEKCILKDYQAPKSVIDKK